MQVFKNIFYFSKERHKLLVESEKETIHLMFCLSILHPCGLENEQNQVSKVNRAMPHPGFILMVFYLDLKENQRMRYIHIL